MVVIGRREVGVPSTSLVSAGILILAGIAAADWSVWAVRGGEGGGGSEEACDELPRSLWQWMRVSNSDGHEEAMVDGCAADETSLFSLSFWRVLLALGAMGAPRVTALSMWGLDRKNTLLLMRALQGCLGFGLEVSRTTALANFVGHFLCFLVCPSFLFLIPAIQLRAASPAAAALVTVSTLVLGTCETVASVLYVFGQHAQDVPSRGVVTVRLVDERQNGWRADAGTSGQRVRGEADTLDDGVEDNDDDEDGGYEREDDGDDMAGIVVRELETTSGYMSSNSEEGQEDDEEEQEEDEEEEEEEDEEEEDEEDEEGDLGTHDDGGVDDDARRSRSRRSRSSSISSQNKLTTAAGLLRMWLLVVAGEILVFFWLAVMAADIKFFTVPTAKALISWGGFLTAHLVGVGSSDGVDTMLEQRYANSTRALEASTFRGAIDDDASPLLSSVMCVEVILAVVMGVVIRIAVWIVVLPAHADRMSRYDSIANTIAHLEASIRGISATLANPRADSEINHEIVSSIRFPPAIDIPPYYEPSDERFRCPITMMPMTEPAIATSSGITYERSAVESWMRRHNREPTTRRYLPRCAKALTPRRHRNEDNETEGYARQAGTEERTGDDASSSSFGDSNRLRGTAPGGGEDSSEDEDEMSSCCVHIVPNLALRGMIEEDVERCRAQHALLMKKIFAVKRESGGSRRRKHRDKHAPYIERRRKKTRSETPAPMSPKPTLFGPTPLSNAWPALKESSLFVSTLGIFDSKKNENTNENDARATE